MKAKFLKHFCVYLCVVIVLVFFLVLCLSSVSVLASDLQSVYLQPDVSTAGNVACVYNGDECAEQSSLPATVFRATYNVDLEFLNLFETTGDLYRIYQFLSPSYKLTSAYDNAYWPNNGFLAPIVLSASFDGVSAISPLSLDLFVSFDSFLNFLYSSEGLFASLHEGLENGASISLTFQSLTPDPGIYYFTEVSPSQSIYQSAWDLLVNFIYGEGAELTPEMHFTLTLLATLLVIAVVLVPFAIVWIVITKLFSWW